MNDTTQWQPLTSRWSPRLPGALSRAPDLLTAATMLASHGIPVFPCTPGEKQPLTSHGFHDASADTETARKWWTRWPVANIGLPTGDASGVDVVDIDVHPGGSGFAAYEAAKAAGRADGWAWLVRTPSGGVHAYHLRGSAAAQRSWQVPRQHVDFRGAGGYVIVPPSRVDGRSYELIAVAQHRVGPVDGTALREFLEPPRPPRPPVSPPALGARADKLADWVASRPEGARNHGLFWAACRMVEEGHPFGTTARVLGDAARAAGLSDQEAMTTVRSAYRTASQPAATDIARLRNGTEAVAL